MKFNNYQEISNYCKKLQEKEMQEFERKWAAEANKRNKEIFAKMEQKRKEAAKMPKKQCQGYNMQKSIEDSISRGEIISPFIRQHLKAKITSARYALATGMLITVLFKGQWILWILFIIWYNCYVKEVRKKALEADRKGLKRK